MPRKRRKKEEEAPSVTLFQFIESKKEEVKQTSLKEEAKVEETKVQEQEYENYENIIYSYISQKGKVSKDEIYIWSKRRNISPAELYRAIISLERKGLIRKRFDAEVGQLVYELVT